MSKSNVGSRYYNNTMKGVRWRKNNGTQVDIIPLVINALVAKQRQNKYYKWSSRGRGIGEKISSAERAK